MARSEAENDLIAFFYVLRHDQLIENACAVPKGETPHSVIFGAAHARFQATINARVALKRKSGRRPKAHADRPTRAMERAAEAMRKPT